MRQIDEYKFEFDQQFPDPISKYQWHLQKVIKEKKDLEKQIETMRSQLLTEKRGHDATKKQLEILQRYCEKYAENQPGDEVL
jgi:antitoxin component HigA of HigAB toxin-antitoxin module